MISAGHKIKERLMEGTRKKFPLTLSIKEGGEDVRAQAAFTEVKN